jgi:hypothetical protein
MKIHQAYEAVKLLCDSMPEIFSSVLFEFPFIGRPHIGSRSSNSSFGVPISGDGVGSKSGIYLFATPAEEIIYIGKAAKNNLHGRVWGHLKTPAEDSNGNWLFPNCEFNSFGLENEAVKFVREGEALLGIITISESQVVSLAEVYLHTLHHKNFGRLPAFNKQIG